MLVLLIALIVSLLPFTFIYLRLRNHVREDDAYKKLCDKTLVQGMLCVFTVLLFSGVSYLLLRLTGLHKINALLYEALYTFIVLALMEEIAKYLAFRRVLKKMDRPCSWLDAVVLMSIVGIGFGFLESIVYSLGASVPVILVRGICVPHAGYGFLVGYFYGKDLKNGTGFYKWIGLTLAWFMHGLYDFSLSEEFIAINENLVIVALLMALVEIVLVIMLLVFVRREKKREAAA